MTWLRALWRAECSLVFTSCGPDVELGEEGAWLLRRDKDSAAACCVLLAVAVATL